MIDEDGKILVILDSDHHTSHVAKELQRFSGMVSQGSYLIVEDGNIDGMAGWPTGPGKAIADFLKVHPEFEVDYTREKYFITFNPSGFLRRK
jgi:cephalosporin hydroxylase